MRQRLPWAHVCARNTVRIDKGVLLGYPVGEFGFKGLLALGQAGFGLLLFERLVIFNRQDHRIYLA